MEDKGDDKLDNRQKLPMKFQEPLHWDKLLFLYETAMEQVLTKINVINKESKFLHQRSSIEHITYRIKSSQSIMRKLEHQDRVPTLDNVVKYIQDVAGIRIICSFSNEIFDIAAALQRQRELRVLKVKDYVTHPKPNGYMSYHMILEVPVQLLERIIYVKVEVQIRTIAMDFWASLEHKIYYKYEGNAPEHLARELKECADITQFLDRKMLAIHDEFQEYRKEEVVFYEQESYHQKIALESIDSMFFAEEEE